MKIWLIIATCLIVIGLLLFVVVMSLNGWDFTKLSTSKYVTNTYEITNDFKNISIDTKTTDIAFYLSEDNTCKVVCEEDEKLLHSVEVSNGTLTIKLIDNRAWYDYIGISLGKTKISVYLPKSEYETLDINNTTGDVEIPDGFSFGSTRAFLSTGSFNSSADVSEDLRIKTSTGSVTLWGADVGNVDIEVSTGSININDVVATGVVRLEVNTGKANVSGLNCKKLISEGDTGDLHLENVIASEKIEIERDTGDVTFEDCDAFEIFIETDTGDVSGSLLSEKVFIVKSDTGKIDVPKSISGGRCEIETDTGDVKIRIK